jgi:hypothetical protein
VRTAAPILLLPYIVHAAELRALIELRFRPQFAAFPRVPDQPPAKPVVTPMVSRPR